MYEFVCVGSRARMNHSKRVQEVVGIVLFKKWDVDVDRVVMILPQVHLRNGIVYHV